MTASIKPCNFTSKYGIGEIVEMKQEGSHMFVGRVIAVGFAENMPPMYTVRRPDGHVMHFAEAELCVRGVDYDVPDQRKTDEEFTKMMRQHEVRDAGPAPFAGRDLGARDRT